MRGEVFESERTSRRTPPRSVRWTASSVTRAPESSLARRTRLSRTLAGTEASSARRIPGPYRCADSASVSSRWSRRLDSSDGATAR